jgi:two-component system response regulator BaeR
VEVLLFDDPREPKGARDHDIGADRMNASRVLVIEDEPKIAALVVDYLKAAGYAAEAVGDGSAAQSAFERLRPDLVLLDLMLPGKDGLTICRELRAVSTVPIVMLTARVEEIDRLLGLELGADDYICKPFSPREVVARVKAVLRRAAFTAASDGGLAADAPLVLDPDKFEARWRGRLLDLTPVEFRLLARLAERPGRVLSRAKLMEGLYLDHRIVSDRTVDSHVKNLRRKISDVDATADPVVSVYGVGYKLEL